LATIQKLITYGGIKKQTAKGAVAATPAIVGFGISGGQILSTPIESSYEDLTLSGATTSDRFAPTTNRTKIQPGAAFTTRATPSSLASFMLAALGTDSTVTFVHTLTPAIALPYWGIMGKYGATPEITRLNDAKCDTLKLSVDETNPVELDMTWLGTSLTPDFTWTATNDDSVVQPLGPFGGTFQFDLDGTTLAAEPITGFSVEINNNLQPVFLSNAILPDDIVEGEQVIEGTITVKPTNLDGWQNILTGTAGGTTPRTAPLFGKFQLTITNGSESIVMTANRVEFLTDFPSSDPAGGAGELALAYRVVRPTDATAAFTAVVTNLLTGVIT
jgi:hypothetical protein